MRRIIVNEDNFILRVSNDFLMKNTIMKPNEYVLYLNIFRLIQRIEKANEKNELYLDRDEYTFTRNDLSGIFNEHTYENSKLNKILDGMMENQIEEIILNCDYNGKELTVKFDSYEFDRYFMVNKNYTTFDIKDVIGLKGTKIIKIIMLINRFSQNGWIKVKEEDIRMILGKDDMEYYETKYITRELKDIVSKFTGKYKIIKFEPISSNNKITYEFKFDSFKYIY